MNHVIIKFPCTDNPKIKKHFDSWSLDYINISMLLLFQFTSSVQGVPGYETITSTTPAHTSVRRLASVKFLYRPSSLN